MKIEQTNQKIKFAGNVREALYRNEFYTEDKINRLFEILVATVPDVVKSSIDKVNKCIKLLLKNDHSFDRFGASKFNSMIFYQCTDSAFVRFFKEYRAIIYSIFGPTDAESFYRTNAQMFYTLQKIDNCLIISL